MVQLPMGFYFERLNSRSIYLLKIYMQVEEINTNVHKMN